MEAAAAAPPVTRVELAQHGYYSKWPNVPLVDKTLTLIDKLRI